MPVTFAPGWVPSPSTGASVFGGIASGIQNALETYRAFKKDKEEHDFRVKEMALRSQEAEARRAEQAQLQQIRQHQLEREQTEEGIATEAERAALGVEGQKQKEIGDLGALIAEATKTGFTAPQIQTPAPSLAGMGKKSMAPAPLASMINPNAFAPQAPLSTMITAPELAPPQTAADRLAASEQAATQAAAAPSGPLSISQRAAGRKAIADQAFDRQVGERERQENVTFERQRRLLESQEGIADKRIQAQQAAAEAAAARSEGRALHSVFDKQANENVMRTAAQINADPARYVSPKTAGTGGSGKPLAVGEVGKTSDFLQGLETLRNLGSKAGSSGETGTLPAAKAALIPNLVTEYTGWGADAKSRQAVLDTAKQIIGKAMEGGVLRKEDEAKYIKILPTLKDAPQVAKSKIDDLVKQMARDSKIYIRTLKAAGRDTDEIEKEFADFGYEIGSATQGAGNGEKGGKGGAAKPHDPLGLFE